MRVRTRTGESGICSRAQTKPATARPKNTINPNQGYVYFYCANSPTPQRFVNIELRDGTITAQGTLGK